MAAGQGGGAVGECWPEAALGPMPHVYPFIVNDPGEGTQAKRRAQAVIVDHLTPPLTRAESYGPLRDLEALVDEYYEAAGLDPRRIDHLRREIVEPVRRDGTGRGCRADREDEERDLAKLDAWLCELKEAQIRDGLHVFGQVARGAAGARSGAGAGAGAARRGRGRRRLAAAALAADLGLEFDPLDCDMGAAGRAAPRGAGRRRAVAQRGRHGGAAGGAGGAADRRGGGPAGAALCRGDGPCASRCAHGRRLRPGRGAGLLTALSGHFVAPGASGAPTRGRLDVLPTGRNFFSVDSRAVPTPTAWALGWKSANLLIERHLQDHGDWPRALLITAWGTANMRTGGDDIAQALALMGVRPRWDRAAARDRVRDHPGTALGRPRVDVTLRVSGFFRDAFPQQIALVDAAARAVMALDEPEDVNPAAARAQNRRGRRPVPGLRSKPGAYGAGLQALIDERLWSTGAIWPRPICNGGLRLRKGCRGAGPRGALEARLGRSRHRAEPGQPGARPAGQRRLLPVRGRRVGALSRICKASRGRSITMTIRGPSGR